MVSLDRTGLLENPLIGYYRSLGVAAVDHKEAMERFTKVISDGLIDWEQSRFLQFEQLQADIASRYEKSTQDVWYLSGRSFFQSED